MKKSTIFLAVSLMLSLVLNLALFSNVAKNSYIVENHPRLKQDTRILGSLLDTNYKKINIKKSIEKNLPSLQIESKENVKSMWNWDGPEYPYALTVGGLNFFFDENETLIRLDHWLLENSPLYDKNH